MKVKMKAIVSEYLKTDFSVFPVQSGRAKFKELVFFRAEKKRKKLFVPRNFCEMHRANLIKCKIY